MRSLGKRDQLTDGESRIRLDHRHVGAIKEQDRTPVHRRERDVREIGCSYCAPVARALEPPRKVFQSHRSREAWHEEIDHRFLRGIEGERVNIHDVPRAIGDPNAPRLGFDRDGRNLAKALRARARAAHQRDVNRRRGARIKNADRLGFDVDEREHVSSTCNVGPEVTRDEIK